MKTMSDSVCAVLLGAPGGVRLGGGGPGSRRPGRLTIAVIPKGTSHVFWQSIHAGAAKGGPGAGRRRSSGGARCARTTATRRSPRSRASSAAASPASCSLRSTRRRWCGPVAKRRRSKIPVVIFDSGLKGERLRQLRRHRQPEGRPAGRRTARRSARRQGQGRAAALRRRVGQHQPARGGFPGGDEGAARASRSSARTSTAARTSRARTRRRRRCSAATRTPDGSLRSTASSVRTSRPRSRCCACSQDNGWAGKVSFVGFDAPTTW